MVCQLSALSCLLKKLVDVVRAMLYGNATFNSWWSGEEMFQLYRTSRSHRDQVQFGVAPFFGCLSPRFSDPVIMRSY
jgi:hypothetical protein